MKKYVVTLTKDERDELTALNSKGKHRSQKILNALILLNCDRGEFQKRRSVNEEISRLLCVGTRKIDRVKKRFVEDGFDVALDGRKGSRTYAKKTDGDFEAHPVAPSCGKPPDGYARWSLRLLADRVVELDYIESISHETVRRILKKTKSSPGDERVGQFRLKKAVPLSPTWRWSRASTSVPTTPNVLPDAWTNLPNSRLPKQKTPFLQPPAGRQDTTANTGDAERAMCFLPANLWQANGLLRSLKPGPGKTGPVFSKESPPNIPRPNGLLLQWTTSIPMAPAPCTKHFRRTKPKCFGIGSSLSIPQSTEAGSTWPRLN